MKIRLSDPELYPQLLAFLRKEGCIALVEEGALDALRPHSFGIRERDEIKRLVQTWLFDHPNVAVNYDD